MRKFEINEYEIRTDKLPAESDGFKFIFLSDMHSNCYKVNLDCICEVVDNEKPDAVLLGGDMINKSLKDDITITANFIRKIAEKHLVLYALGNHEYSIKLNDDEYGGRYLQYMDFLQENGVIILDDDVADVEKNGNLIKVYGLSIDSVFYNKKFTPVMGDGLLYKHIGDPKKKYFNILLAHKPDFFFNYANWGADLVLSGHVHGGIVRLPKFGGVISPDIKLFPYFDAGTYEYENSTMLIGRGIGTHSVNIRINNRPELIVVKVLAK